MSSVSGSWQAGVGRPPHGSELWHCVSPWAAGVSDTPCSTAGKGYRLRGCGLGLRIWTRIWTTSTGYLSINMLRSHCHPPSASNITLSFPPSMLPRSTFLSIPLSTSSDTSPCLISSISSHLTRTWYHSLRLLTARRYYDSYSPVAITFRFHSCPRLALHIPYLIHPLAAISSRAVIHCDYSANDSRNAMLHI